MAAKQEARAEDLERQMEKMRAEFDERIEKLQSKLNKSLEREGLSLEEQEDLVNTLRMTIEGARGRVRRDVDTSRETIREHPLLMVGGALAVGLMLGALFAKSRD
jgi:ElaB/YqjD/DUF883 family membrane-anchored ribosome-binding protein